jgi:hypothetical protein
LTVVFAAESLSLAVTRDDPASRIIAIITGAIKLATHTLFLFIVLFLF